MPGEDGGGVCGGTRAAGGGDGRRPRDNPTAGRLVFGGCLPRGNGWVGVGMWTARKNFNTEDEDDCGGPRSRGVLPPAVPAEGLRGALWSSLSSVLKCFLPAARADRICTRQHPTHREKAAGAGMGRPDAHGRDGPRSQDNLAAGSRLFGGCLSRGNGQACAGAWTVRKDFNTEDEEDHKGPRSRGALPPAVRSGDLRDPLRSSSSSVLNSFCGPARATRNCMRKHPMHREAMAPPFVSGFFPHDATPCPVRNRRRRAGS